MNPTNAPLGEYTVGACRSRNRPCGAHAPRERSTTDPAIELRPPAVAEVVLDHARLDHGSAASFETSATSRRIAARPSHIRHSSIKRWILSGPGGIDGVVAVEGGQGHVATHYLSALFDSTAVDMISQDILAGRASLQ